MQYAYASSPLATERWEHPGWRPGPLEPAMTPPAPYYYPVQLGAPSSSSSFGHDGSGQMPALVLDATAPPPPTIPNIMLPPPASLKRSGSSGLYSYSSQVGNGNDDDDDMALGLLQTLTFRSHPISNSTNIFNPPAPFAHASPLTGVHMNQNHHHHHHHHHCTPSNTESSLTISPLFPAAPPIATADGLWRAKAPSPEPGVKGLAHALHLPTESCPVARTPRPFDALHYLPEPQAREILHSQGEGMMMVMTTRTMMIMMVVMMMMMMMMMMMTTTILTSTPARRWWRVASAASPSS
jgi:hypothetical protein